MLFEEAVGLAKTNWLLVRDYTYAAPFASQVKNSSKDETDMK